MYFVRVIKHGKVTLCSNRKHGAMAERKAKFEQKHFKEKASASDNIIISSVFPKLLQYIDSNPMPIHSVFKSNIKYEIEYKVRARQLKECTLLTAIWQCLSFGTSIQVRFVQSLSAVALSVLSLR